MQGNLGLPDILQEKHGWVSVRCAGHTLQLVINHALKNPQISKALGAARCLVEHFKRSELTASKLKMKQKQMETPEHKLTWCTRWKKKRTRCQYQVELVSFLLEQRWPVTATLSDPAVTERETILRPQKRSVDPSRRTDPSSPGLWMCHCVLECLPHCLSYNFCAGLPGSCFRGNHCTVVRRGHLHRW